MNTYFTFCILFITIFLFTFFSGAANAEIDFSKRMKMLQQQLGENSVEKT